MVSIVKINLLKKRIAIAFCLLIVIGSNRAVAQSTTIMTDFLPTMNMINLQNHVLWNPYQKKTTPNKARLTVRPNVVNQLSYTPSLVRRKQNLAQFVARSRAVDPEGSNQLAQVFASNDVILAASKAMAKFGLRSDNLADVYALYWSSTWLASVGSSATPTRAQFAKVKTQSGAALAAVPNVIGASDQQKQQFAEALLVQTLLIEASVEKAQHNPAQRKEIANAVLQGARAMGLDLATMTLTNEGFTLIKQ